MTDSEANPTPDRRYWCAGLLLDFLAEAGDTSGEFTLIESVVNQGLEPPPHTHTHEDEEVLVLEGQLYYRFGEQQGTLQRGEYIKMPRQQEHYFRPLGEQVRLMVRLSPGGLEESFKSFGIKVSESPTMPPPEAVPGFGEIARIFADVGVFFSK